jgi:penicillin-binding protein 2
LPSTPTAFGYGQKTGIDLPGEQAGLMPSAQWKMKNYHNRWYPDETLDVAIGQGAVEATPLQLARIIGGIASGGHMVRPHVVFPDQLSGDFRKALLESFPGLRRHDRSHRSGELDHGDRRHGRGDAARRVSHRRLGAPGRNRLRRQDRHRAGDEPRGAGQDEQGHATNPNVWFVGVTPRRNPELVVAVLWQNGQFSYYPARIGAKIVSAYVEKQRRLANNLVVPAKPPAPTEMSAVWTVPNPAGAKPGQGAPDRLEDRAVPDRSWRNCGAGCCKSESISGFEGIRECKGSGFERARL